MAITQYPGFTDPVLAAQKTFRALLMAMAHPGEVQTLAIAPLKLPPDLALATGATILTLLDLESSLWLHPTWSEDVRSWIQFHTGCRFCEQPHQADFALLGPLDDSLPALDEFALGTPEIPEASTTLLLQLADLDPATAELPPLSLRGPGIQSVRQLSLPIRSDFWQDWANNQQNYPLGLDLYCLAGDRLLGLPRTTQVKVMAPAPSSSNSHAPIGDLN